MPTGIYPRKPFTDEHKRNISLKHKGMFGKHQSPETKLKMKIAHIGKQSGMKGKCQSPEAKRKMSIAKKDKTYEELYGKERADERKRKIGETGKRNWLLDFEKMKRNHKRGEKHPNYKDDKAGKVAIHIWVKSRKLKPKLCEFCHKEKDYLGRTNLQLANLNNHIYRRNLNEWKYGHTSCHRNFDLKNGK
jgi:hypothetical protein